MAEPKTPPHPDKEKGKAWEDYLRYLLEVKPEKDGSTRIRSMDGWLKDQEAAKEAQKYSEEQREFARESFKLLSQNRVASIDALQEWARDALSTYDGTNPALNPMRDGPPRKGMGGVMLDPVLDGPGQYDKTPPKREHNRQQEQFKRLLSDNKINTSEFRELMAGGELNPHKANALSAVIGGERQVFTPQADITSGVAGPVVMIDSQAKGEQAAQITSITVAKDGKFYEYRGEIPEALQEYTRNMLPADNRAMPDDVKAMINSIIEKATKEKPLERPADGIKATADAVNSLTATAALPAIKREQSPVPGK